MSRPAKHFSSASFIVATLLMATFSASAWAGTLSYKFTIVEDLHVLEDPNNMNMMHMAAWQTQHELLVARNMPFIEIQNTSETATLTGLTLTIGNSEDTFDYAYFIEGSPGVTMTVVSPDTLPNGAKSDELKLSFANLGPGDFARFQVDIDPDSGNMMPDYRFTMFDLNGVSTADNSLLTVSFLDPATGPGTLSDRLPEFTSNMPTMTGIGFRTAYGMDSVMPFSFGGQSPPVPEPSSVVLLALGAVGIVAYGQRRRGQSVLA